MAEIKNDSEALVVLLQARLEDKKALDMVRMDLRSRMTFTDFFLVATGTSHTHLSTLAEEVDRFFHERGLRLLGTEGLPDSEWVLVDAGNVVVHLFLETARQFYDLEKLWSPKSRPLLAKLEGEESVVTAESVPP